MNHLCFMQEDGESKAKQYTVNLDGGAHGQLEAAHLADHPSAVAVLQAAVQVGSPLGPLLVLDRVEVMVFLSQLFSLLHVLTKATSTQCSQNAWGPATTLMQPCSRLRRWPPHWGPTADPYHTHSDPERSGRYAALVKGCR